MPLSVRLSIFYGSLCIFGGINMPFFPVWLESKGLGPHDIALVLAATMFLRIVAGPVFAFVADRWENRRGVAILLSWASLASVSLFLLTDTFWPIFLVSALLMSLWPSVTPLVESIAMRATREQGVDYGRVRLWCSITFVMAATGGGWLLEWNPASIIIFCMIGAIAIGAAGAHLLVKERPAAKRLRRPGGQFRISLALARHPLFLVGLLTASLVQATHAVYYAFGTLNWQQLGYGENLIGILWAVGVVAEIILFAFSARVLRRFSAPALLMIGAGAAILRWTLTAFDPPLWGLFGLQVLHAATFCAAHLGAMHFVASAAPGSLAATAQSLYGALSSGVIMGAATLIAGPLYQAFGGQAYLLSAALGLLGLIGALWLASRWNGGVLIEDTGDTEEAGETEAGSNDHRDHPERARPGC